MADSEVRILDTNGEPKKIATDEDDANVHVQTVWLVRQEDLA